MNPYDPQHTRAHLNGDPDLFIEYHQDYREGIRNRYTNIEFLVPLLLCSLPIIYHILFILDYDLLPLPELLWNILVYLTPSRLVDAVEDFTNPLHITNPSLRGLRRTHAAKSESMRRILGLDNPGGIMGSVAQAGRRRLSTLPGLNIAPQRTESDKPAGLGNWDNSCYQNSVLQGLASLDSLSGYLTNPTIKTDGVEGPPKPDMKMAEALRDLIEMLNDPSNNGKRLWTPATLKNMSSWQQQDAQEYFSKVLDEIDKEVGKAASILHSSQGFESEDGYVKTAPIATFRNPLEGLIAQRVGCMKCGYSEGLSMIPFNCLTVPLGRAWEHRISECLDEYTKLEKIDGVECGKCTLLKFQRLFTKMVERTKDDTDNKLHHDNAKTRLEAVTEALEMDDYDEKTLFQKCKITAKNRVASTKTRQAVIARPPKSLVIHFNRSLFDELTGDLRKNSSEVRFPKILDLGPWCLGSSKSTEDNEAEEWRLNPESPMIAGTKRPSSQRGPYYEVRAVVTHYGRHENGHYICYRKHATVEADDAPKKMQWWRLSDEDVHKVTEETVLGQGGVFMLFYDLIEPAISALQRRVPEALLDGEVKLKSISSQSTTATHSFNAIQPATEMIRLPELALAASVPLPDIPNEDLSEPEFQSQYQNLVLQTAEPSIGTSSSEFEDEETNDGENVRNALDYKPAEPILVSPYVPQRSVDNSSTEGTKQQNVLNPGSLLMV
jgi:ubiquitin carboxyl-terminal hydrolase 1